MEDDTPDADQTAHTAAHGTADRIPVHVPDRFERQVRDDHAANAALHSALRVIDDFDAVNLMGSHAPGEKTQRPRYTVRITIENAGMGEPSTGETVLKELVQRDDVRIVAAYGGARYNDVKPDDTGQDAIEKAVDGLTVEVRPVEKTVEPITITPNDLPAEYVDIDDVEHTAGRTLRKVVDEHGVDSDRAHEAARSLATAVAVHGDPDDKPTDVRDRLWSIAGADPETGDTSPIRPAEDGFLFEAPADERVRPLSHMIDTALSTPTFASTSDDFPKTRPPVGPLREWVADNLAVPSDQIDETAERVADAIEHFATHGDVDPDAIRDHDDATGDKIPIVCGCGEFAVDVPAGKTPDAIDVVCPECSNHFGHDTDGVTSVESPGDPFDLDTARYPAVADAILSACDQYEDDTDAPGASLPFVIDDVIAEYRTSAVLWEAFRMYATGEVYSPEAGAIRAVEPPDTSGEDTVAGDE